MTTCPSCPGPGEIPDTPLLRYFRSPLFNGPRGKTWGADRIAELTRLLDNSGELASKFADSVADVERCYRNYQPFYPREHTFHEDQSRDATVDVARRLATRDVWEVGNNSRLNFRYLDREIEIARSNPGPVKPPGGTLLIDLFLANASDRTPILCEVKRFNDQCAFYGLIQLLTQATYAATASQRERLVLLGSQPAFVLREAIPGKPGRLDLYILLVEPKKGKPYDDISPKAILLSQVLVRDPRVRSKIRRIEWIEGRYDGKDGLVLSDLRARA